MGSREYLETIQKIICEFEKATDQNKRFKMVGRMEKHILSLNRITQEILLDDHPIRFLMQYEWIETRVTKTENLLDQLKYPEKRKRWETFLSESITFLVQTYDVSA